MAIEFTEEDLENFQKLKDFMEEKANIILPEDRFLYLTQTGMDWKLLFNYSGLRTPSHIYKVLAYFCEDAYRVIKRIEDMEKANPKKKLETEK